MVPCYYVITSSSSVLLRRDFVLFTVLTFTLTKPFVLKCEEEGKEEEEQEEEKKEQKEEEEVGEEELEEEEEDDKRSKCRLLRGKRFTWGGRGGEGGGGEGGRG